MAVAATTQESLYLVHLLNGMDKDCKYMPVTIFEDNQGAIVSSNMQHIDIKYHLVRSALNDAG